MVFANRQGVVGWAFLVALLLLATVYVLAAQLLAHLLQKRDDALGGAGDETVLFSQEQLLDRHHGLGHLNEAPGLHARAHDDGGLDAGAIAADIVSCDEGAHAVSQQNDGNAGIHFLGQLL